MKTQSIIKLVGTLLIAAAISVMIFAFLVMTQVGPMLASVSWNG